MSSSFSDSTSSSSGASSSVSSSLYTITPSIAEDLFRMVEGQRYQSLNDIYTWPFDSSTEVYERLSLEFKARISGGLFWEPDGKTGELRRLLTEERKEEARVLDVGCGILGLWASSMGLSYPKAEVIGLDLVAPDVQKTPANVTYEVWDVVDGLPYRDEWFDVIRLGSLAFFLPNYKALIVEALRCLNPNGILLLLEPEGRIHLGPMLIDWISLQSPSPDKPPSVFDTLGEIARSASLPSSSSPSPLFSDADEVVRFDEVEEKTWMIPVGVGAVKDWMTPLEIQLSQLKTQILLLLLKNSLLDPKKGKARVSDSLAWVERLVTTRKRSREGEDGVGLGEEDVLSGFKLVWARKGSGKG